MYTGGRYLWSINNVCTNRWFDIVQVTPLYKNKRTKKLLNASRLGVFKQELMKQKNNGSQPQTAFYWPVKRKNKRKRKQNKKNARQFFLHATCLLILLRLKNRLFAVPLRSVEKLLKNKTKQNKTKTNKTNQKKKDKLISTQTKYNQFSNLL